MDEVIKLVVSAVTAALVALIIWISKRQVRRIDSHDDINTKQTNDISSLDKKVEGFGMHLGSHKSEVLGHVIRLEGDHDEIKSAMLLMKADTDKRIDALARNTDKKIDATNKLFERQMTLLIDVFKDKQ
jgi:hypothetical protein